MGNNGDGASAASVVAKWLLIVFAAVVLAFDLWGADAPDVVVGSFLLLPWIVGPAALAAFLAARAWSPVESWLFVGLETAVVASTLGLTAMLFLNAEPQNAQAGIGLLMLPLLQFTGVLVYFFCVMVFAQSVRAKNHSR